MRVRAGACHSSRSACLTACSPDVAADVLLVGPDRSLRMPSEAAAVVQDGDVVRFDPGEYVDCAIWRASSLVLEAPEGTARARSGVRGQGDLGDRRG